MARIDNPSQYSDGSFTGWHPGQYPVTNKFKWYNFGGSKTFNGVTWWANILPNVDDEFAPADLFSGTGGLTQLNNAKRYNTCAFIGADVNNSDFTTDGFKYGENSATSGVRDVIGFSCQNTCSGSHSDKGGDAQAFLEKVGLFYADINTGNRYTFTATEKVAGSWNLNNKYADQNLEYYTYRLKPSNIEAVNKNNYVLMGMAFQFVHTGKTASHTSRCTLKNMRILCGDGTGLVAPSVVNRIMLVGRETHTLGDFKYDRPISYSF